MQKRISGEGYKRLLSLSEAKVYLGLGTTRTRQIAEEWGAIVKIGGRTLCDRVVLDEHINSIKLEKTL